MVMSFGICYPKEGAWHIEYFKQERGEKQQVLGVSDILEAGHKTSCERCPLHTQRKEHPYLLISLSSVSLKDQEDTGRKLSKKPGLAKYLQVPHNPDPLSYLIFPLLIAQTLI